MQATHILDRLAEKYAQCSTYSDRGVVDFDGSAGNKEQLLFRTLFARPNYFSFEWQDYGPARGKSKDFSILWSKDRKTKTLYLRAYERDFDIPRTLQFAIAGATGCSAGAAHRIASLLREDVRENTKNLLQLTELELIREEKLLDQECYVIAGSLSKYHDYTLWISINDFSLLRIYEVCYTTAKEWKERFKEIRANQELMAKLAEKGIAPPGESADRDTIHRNQYTYLEVSFDKPVKELPEPMNV